MSENFRADLHCHTRVSDGSATPEEVVALAASVGLQGLSITDHDTVAAIAKASPIAEKQQIQLLSGVEFSCSHKGTSVHVLAYAFHEKNPFIIDFCQKHKIRRQERFSLLLDRLQKIGIVLDLSEIEKTVGYMPGRPHLAQMMVQAGYVPDVQAAFHKYLGENRPGYVPSVSFSVEETLDVIHQAGGLAVIAHPILIKKKRVYQDLLAMPFDGLEGYYARFHKTDEAPFIQEAEKRGLFITGGSDFHGDVKPRIHLGSSWTPQQTFSMLWNHYKGETR